MGGIDTNRGVYSVVQDDMAKDLNFGESKKKFRKSFQLSSSSLEQPEESWTVKFTKHLGDIFGVDNLLFIVRLTRQILLWSTAAVVHSIEFASGSAPFVIPISQGWLEWAKENENAASQAVMLEWTSDAIDALFDVHGYQIFNQGLFNADAHPGNILLIQNDDKNRNSEDSRRWKRSRPKLGLIDYGQCKRLDIEDRRRVARLVLSVANEESD